MSTINNIQGKYKVLIVSSSHKNSNRKETKSVSRTELSNKTECERYWEARTKIMEN